MRTSPCPQRNYHDYFFQIMEELFFTHIFSYLCGQSLGLFLVFLKTSHYLFHNQQPHNAKTKLQRRKNYCATLLKRFLQKIFDFLGALFGVCMQKLTVK